MIHIYKPSDGTEYKLAGKLTASGEIDSVESESDEATMDLCADDLRDMHVEDFLSLHDGPHTVAVDRREPEEIPDEELERMQAKQVRDQLTRVANTGEIVKTDSGKRDISEDELLRLLDSHVNSYPMEKLMAVLRDRWKIDKLALMEKECDSDVERRRFVARQSDVAQIAKTVQSSLE
jgi:hypothetical protein